MSRARIVLFDLGGVVAAWDPAPRLAEYARRARTTPDEVQARLATDDFWEDTDRGLYSADEMAERICTLLGHPFSRAELLRLQAAAFTLRPEIVHLARSVAGRTRVGMLTNNAPLLREAMPRHFPEIVRVFDPVLFSFQFRALKPERALFERVTEHLRLAPAEIAFVDDTPGHVAAARASGWDAMLFESEAQLHDALRERGVLT